MIFSLFDLSYRAPILGSIFMCMSCAIIGSIVFLKKRSLLGEAVSHATYPGVVLGGFFGGITLLDISNPFFLFLGAFISSFLGLLWIQYLQERQNFSADAALCTVLSVFIGIGVLLASQLQFSHPMWYQKIQVLLYGQAALLRDAHLWFYILMGVGLLFAAILLSPRLKIALFDMRFASIQGINLKAVEFFLMLVMCLVLVFGIKSLGVIMVSGMMIAPSVTARYLSDRYLTFQLLAAGFGALSGFIGVSLSILIPKMFDESIRLPTGPLILITSSVFALISMLFSPNQGLFFRKVRAYLYKIHCLSENALKALWKAQNKPLTRKQVFFWHPTIFLLQAWTLLSLKRHGWIQKNDKNAFVLTRDGFFKAETIVRLHRLWEVYLVHCVGMSSQKVHRSAEEMEHIITPQIEKQLIEMIGDVEEDPHEKPIPKRRTL